MIVTLFALWVMLQIETISAIGLLFAVIADAVIMDTIKSITEAKYTGTTEEQLYQKRKNDEQD